MLKNKTIVLGVTGSIAAYKAANLASMLKKEGADVHVIMTQNAINFINPITFETLTGNKCLTDTFDRNFEFSVEHVSLAKKADIIAIAPASADIIAKCSHGIADDMLTTTVLAATCPKLIVPAMNTRMYENSITQENLEHLKKHGFTIMTPESGYLACGDSGKGRFPKEDLILEEILYNIAFDKDLTGKKILITAGPTREALDPVRFITNYSTGKMGYAIAKAAMLRGADVTLVSGPVSIQSPSHIELVPITSAKELFEKATKRAENADIVIATAAVADFRPSSIADNKIRKEDKSENEMTLTLERTEDTLSFIGKNKKKGQILCGFAMETEDLEAHAKDKLDRKNLDLICANNVKVEGAGFGVDTNVITVITKEGAKHLPLMSKFDAANEILTICNNL
ncbi:MAG: bifunctional phosphopantothenoylcysteine decarboxylase/phosphopantothenate--cysteine ligase CoaBC [Butyrivibrio sp.]|uniref:bifunctional phosphopantothenoylcysteine decarboxylase/phosphopantothenate--cysteine ligase CoaBC n=1 Tax=Butyrivibrio sp. TaxID=28121 RepID=UPI0025E15988|nr:bifunctional phosphopantothenoylcysteine decarboxylase/phosphopantothenate--cysteine ligase CoaBC [Butyrivibrio sp.]MCR5770684.1 bifunctional phosphopantothenoylcysteine decarboxylase/phosphopantothenate--cysteine ligase CoaBC [Butyrivibrio sp.]